MILDTVDATLEGVLSLAKSLLSLALTLLDNTFGLEPRVAGRLAHGLLDIADSLIGETFSLSVALPIALSFAGHNSLTSAKRGSLALGSLYCLVVQLKPARRGEVLLKQAEVARFAGSIFQSSQG